MRRRTCALLLISTALFGCATRTPVEGARPDDLSRTLGPSMHYEEGKLVFLGVNSGIARLGKEGDPLPLEVAVANKTLPSLTVSDESFTLRCGDERWPSAANEARAGHTLAADVARRTQPLSFHALIDQRFPHYREVPPNIGGSSQDRALVRRVELDRYSWIVVQLWFDATARGAERPCELWFSAPELPDPVFTTFSF